MLDDLNVTKPNSDKKLVKGSFIQNILKGNLQKPQNIQAQLLSKFNYDYNKPPIYYDYVSFLELLEFVRHTQYDTISLEAGYDQLGYRGSLYFFSTPLGLIIKPLLGLASPYKGLLQFVKKMRSYFPWGSHELTQLSDNSVCYTLDLITIPPALMQGMLRAGFELSGISEVSFEIKEFNKTRGHFAITARWR